ncbi:diphosphomevalonate decarboxylase [Corynebacterium sp. USCH3]|uniref:diphosphomevalonate decarboxylase n=1 Tax=Corynebacterium sp. USCH3 TaxID=3024840 RepID=UPI0030B766B3
MSGTATATAHANIALIKYWGKADGDLIIPRTPSLSLTLDELYTTTTVEFGAGAEQATDQATLDGAPVTGRAMERITTFLDIVRDRAGIRDAARVTSVNTVPTAAGLASSASGFAALAGAVAAAAGLDLDPRDLSRLARRGSGSASRSVFGGLALWNAGHDDATSYAESVGNGGEFGAELAIVVLVIDGGPKGVSSREAMRRTVDTSPEYPRWVDRHAGHLAEALGAIAAGDLVRLGEATEANALGMHATMRAAVPPVDYLTAGSHAALQAVRDARDAGLPAWATMDAGPNVKVLTSAGQADALNAWLSDRLASCVPGLRTIVTHAGPGLRVQEGQP